MQEWSDFHIRLDAYLYFSLNSGLELAPIHHVPFNLRMANGGQAIYFFSTEIVVPHIHLWQMSNQWLGGVEPTSNPILVLA